jgi:hypothetical protein
MATQAIPGQLRKRMEQINIMESTERAKRTFSVQTLAWSIILILNGVTMKVCDTMAC